MAAIHASLIAVLQAGDRVVATRAMYGSTRTLLTQRFGRLGVDVAFVDATDLAAVEAALTAARPASLYVETISNPTIVVVDMAALAELAHRHGALLHRRQHVRLAVCSAGRSSSAPTSSSSRRRSTSAGTGTSRRIVAGSRDRIAAVKAVQIDTGATLAPFAAFLVLRGIATLAVRMTRHAARHVVWPTGSRPRRVASPGLLPRPAEPPPARRRRRASSRTPAGCSPSSSPGSRPRRGRRGRVHRRPDDPGADGLARKHPHDRGASADDHPPPIRRGPARGGRHPAGAAPLLGRARGPRRTCIGDFERPWRGARGRRRRGRGSTAARARRPPGAIERASVAGRAARGRAAPNLARARACASGACSPRSTSRSSRSSPWRCSRVFGMTIRQLPGFAFRSAGGLRDRDGPRSTRATSRRSASGVVDLLERLRVPRLQSTRFSVALLVLAISIVVCTLDRTPRLWRQSRDDPGRPAGAVLRPALPGPRRDRPGLAADGRPAPRSAATGSRVREAAGADGARLPLRRPEPMDEARDADHAPRPDPVPRRRRAVTARFGDEQGLVVAEGDTLTVQPIGTPGCCSSRTSASTRPGSRPARPTDFTTDLAVYQDGQELARKTIRVNDPLSVGGLHVPPERVRAGAGPRDPRRRRVGRCGPARSR